MTSPNLNLTVAAFFFSLALGIWAGSSTAHAEKRRIAVEYPPSWRGQQVHDVSEYLREQYGIETHLFGRKHWAMIDEDAFLTRIVPERLDPRAFIHSPYANQIWDGIGVVGKPNPNATSYFSFAGKDLKGNCPDSVHAYWAQQKYGSRSAAGELFGINTVKIRIGDLMGMAGEPSAVRAYLDPELWYAIERTNGVIHSRYLGQQAFSIVAYQPTTDFMAGQGQQGTLHRDPPRGRHSVPGKPYVRKPPLPDRVPAASSCNVASSIEQPSQSLPRRDIPRRIAGLGALGVLGVFEAINFTTGVADGRQAPAPSPNATVKDYSHAIEEALLNPMGLIGFGIGQGFPSVSSGTEAGQPHVDPLHPMFNPNPDVGEFKPFAGNPLVVQIDIGPLMQILGDIPFPSVGSQGSTDSWFDGW